MSGPDHVVQFGNTASMPMSDEQYKAFHKFLNEIAHEALEEAARVCDEQADACDAYNNDNGASNAEACARRIRALKSQEPKR